MEGLLIAYIALLCKDAIESPEMGQDVKALARRLHELAGAAYILHDRPEDAEAIPGMMDYLEGVMDEMGAVSGRER